MQRKKTKVKNYSYDLESICEVLKNKLVTSASFRAISKVFSNSRMFYETICKNPTHTTIINWVHKIGYYQLNREKEKADDWIIILDHSIQLGKEKVFVILGIREKNIDFSRPLQFQDLLPLREISRETWKGEDVKNCLLHLKEEIGGIKYAVGDYSGELKNGLKMASIVHIHDITHKIALILEKCYGKNLEFQELTKDMALMRQNLQQTVYAHAIPPKQRSKSRYQNIGIITDWGMKAIRCIKNPATDIGMKEKLLWIHKYENFLEELFCLNKIICSIEKEIKHFGISKSSLKTCLNFLSNLSNERYDIFKKEFVEYLLQSMKLLPKTKMILGTSDIIESAFGKYKNYISQNPMAGITNLVLSIAAFTSNLELDEIKIALESCTVSDIQQWTERNIGKTLLQRRKELFATV